jgi:hypothetical protein
MVFSNRHAARHHDDASHDLLRQRATRFAREHLIGLTVINHATQLAITLTADALVTTTSRRIPPDLLRLFPRLPEMLSSALYLGTSADPQRRSSIRRLYVLVARGAAAGRDVFFTICENHQSQCFLDRLDVEDQTAHFRSAGGQANAPPNSTGNIPRRYIFVGREMGGGAARQTAVVTEHDIPARRAARRRARDCEKSEPSSETVASGGRDWVWVETWGRLAADLWLDRFSFQYGNDLAERRI